MEIQRVRCGEELKVLHVPFSYAPDPVGGTEIYVETLAQGLRTLGIGSVIAAPSRKGSDETYEHNGLRVRRFRSAAESEEMLRELYGAGDPEASLAFARILDEESPNIVHFHAFTRAVSVLLVRAAKERGLPVFFTYHTPTVSCLRGTLMRWGKQVCDGEQIVRRCSSCSLEGQGLPRSVSTLLSYLPPPIARIVEHANLSGGIWTALRMQELVKAQHQSFQVLMREVDCVVALREWVRTLLVRNRVPVSKIILSQHGIAGTATCQEPMIDVTSLPLRVAFLGRADRVKGIDTLIRAVRGAPELDLELHLYGVTQSSVDDKYWTALKRLAAHDARIVFLPQVPHGEIITLLRSYHVTAVPSRWLETGPLVVLESFAAGVPVIGSNLGGIAEWVRHEQNGLLVSHERVRDWTRALRRCASDRGLLSKLRKGVEMPRSMSMVSQEMAQMYWKHIKAAGGSRVSAGEIQHGDVQSGLSPNCWGRRLT